uniref:Uncharacterized protein n=1 Tax=Acrobeloides nanus TaxID=290746 RepID=A0A914CGK5_9BILA
MDLNDIHEPNNNMLQFESIKIPASTTFGYNFTVITDQHESENWLNLGLRQTNIGQNLVGFEDGAAVFDGIEEALNESANSNVKNADDDSHFLNLSVEHVINAKQQDRNAKSSNPTFIDTSSNEDYGKRSRLVIVNDERYKSGEEANLPAKEKEIESMSEIYSKKENPPNKSTVLFPRTSTPIFQKRVYGRQLNLTENLANSHFSKLPSTPNLAPFSAQNRPLQVEASPILRQNPLPPTSKIKKLVGELRSYITMDEKGRQIKRYRFEKDPETVDMGDNLLHPIGLRSELQRWNNEFSGLKSSLEGTSTQSRSGASGPSTSGEKHLENLGRIRSRSDKRLSSSVQEAIARNQSFTLAPKPDHKLVTIRRKTKIIKKPPVFKPLFSFQATCSNSDSTIFNPGYKWDSERLQHVLKPNVSIVEPVEKLVQDKSKQINEDAEIVRLDSIISENSESTVKKQRRLVEEEPQQQNQRRMRNLSVSVNANQMAKMKLEFLPGEMIAEPPIWPNHDDNNNDSFSEFFILNTNPPFASNLEKPSGVEEEELDDDIAVD